MTMKTPLKSPLTLSPQVISADVGSRQLTRRAESVPAIIYGNPGHRSMQAKEQKVNAFKKKRRTLVPRVSVHDHVRTRHACATKSGDWKVLPAAAYADA